MGTADKTYYLDENSELTEDAEKAAFILINEGQEIPAEMADKYGIGKVTPKAGKVAADDAVDASPEAEKAAAPKANKAASPAKNKGAK